MGPHPDWGMRLLHTLDVRGSPLYLPVPALVVEVLHCPAQLHDLEALVEAADPFLERDIQESEFVFAITETETYIEPSTSDDVQGGDFLSQDHGVVQRCQKDGGTEPYVIVDLGSQPRKHWYRLQPSQFSVEEMLADVEVTQTILLAYLYLAEQPVKLFGGLDIPWAITNQHPKLHIQNSSRTRRLFRTTLRHCLEAPDVEPPDRHLQALW